RTTMKINRVAVIGCGAVVVALAASGCRKTPVDTTYLPGYPKPSQIGDAGNAPPADSLANKELTPTPVTDPDVRKNWARDPEMFRADTAYFDFDSSNIKRAEKSKVAAVAN